MTYIEEYWSKIQSGKIVVGELIKKLYAKVTAQLEAGDFFYDQGKAERAVYFVENLCHHSKGRNDLIRLGFGRRPRSA